MNRASVGVRTAQRVVILKPRAPPWVPGPSRRCGLKGRDTGGKVAFAYDQVTRPSFFLPVRVLRKLFRGKVLAALKAAEKNGDLPASHLPALDPLYRKSWVVYCKPPFGSPEQVLAYLARYTHRIAITNSRLVRLESEEVTFTWRGDLHLER